MTNAVALPKKPKKAVLLELPSEMHLALRVYTVRTGTTMKQWLLNAIKQKYEAWVQEQVCEKREVLPPTEQEVPPGDLSH